LTQKLGLVLGAGGLVGMAYHAGALRALEQVGGVVPGDADLVIGTSAGSVVGAYLRSGWSTEDFWRLALSEGEGVGVEEPFSLSTRSPLELFRRGLGSAYVLSRSLVRLPTPPVPQVVQRIFPGGFFSMEQGRKRLRDELPEEWPAKPLWLVAVDITSGRRVVLGRHRTPPPLPDAVMASCAIPGFFSPVRIGPLTLVDGGAHSTTNLDLAVSDGCDLIIGVAPMAFDTARLPDPLSQVFRRRPARSLAGEAALARRKGVEVLLIRPTAAEVRLHGVRFMRTDGLDRVAHAAYESTARQLETERFRRALAA
jgi:NTE family protein